MLNSQSPRGRPSAALGLCYNKGMSRIYNQNTIGILKFLADKDRALIKDVRAACAPQTDAKDFYNCVFRLHRQGLAEKIDNKVRITEDGKRLLSRLQPLKDGVWKLVIFDIPEKQKYVRVILRAKLKALHFKKWQNSIWVSPYALDAEIEEELNGLARKFFVRLIKTTQINNSDDLEKMFD